jgi:hypothetical protein
VGERNAKSKNWPDSPRALAGRLRRAATFLRTAGIEISFAKEGRGRARIIRITPTGRLSAPENAETPPSAPSAPSEGVAHSTLRADGWPAAAEGPSERPSVSKALNDKATDGADDADGRVLTSEEGAWTL